MPRPHLVRIFAIVYSALFAPSVLSAPLPSLEEPLKDLASDIAHASKKLHCPNSECNFLVTNFVSDDGETSRFAMQLADALSAQLSQTKSASAADRSAFQKFVQSERLPARVQCENSVARWLARRLSANAAIVGRVTISPSGDGKLFVTLLESNQKKGKAIPLSATFTANVPAADLSSSDGLDDETVYPAGEEGVTLPRCLRMPNPSYTDDARNAKFSGTILVEGYVGTDGQVQVFRILKGAPYGLNDSTRQTIGTWQCDPSLLEGKPVPVIVPFEITFRLY
jgi:Gram-negative bacterial TonB protein C-terminal